MSIKICVFGDSISQGYNDYKEGGWINRLRKYFDLSDYDISVFNLGVSGDNTFDLLKRFKVEAEARKPNLIVFAIGINDSQYVNSKNNPRVSLSDFNKNLLEFKNLSKQFTDKIIFIGLTKVDEVKVTPIPWSITKYYDNENIKTYNLAIKNFCEKNHLSFIEMFDLLNDKDLEDGLHPNSKGHKKMFNRVKDSLIKNKII
jgi:lysophospholipase L1-like esterase